MTTTADLSGSTILITGANGGIGKQTALALARTGGASLVLTVRDPAAPACRALEQQVTAAAASGAVTLVPLDLADLRSVRDSAETITRAAPVIDTIINNAGATFTARELTPPQGDRADVRGELCRPLRPHPAPPAEPAARIVAGHHGQLRRAQARPGHEMGRPHLHQGGTGQRPPMGRRSSQRSCSPASSPPGAAASECMRMPCIPG